MATVATLPAKSISRTPISAIGPGPRRDPRVWIVGFFSVTVWVSTATSLILTAVITSLVLVAVVLHRRSNGWLAIPWAPLGWMVFAGLLTIVLYALFGPSESSDSWRIPGLSINAEAIRIGLLMAIRLVSLLALSLLLLSSVPALDLAAGFTRFLAPLREVGFGITSIFYLTFFLSRMVPSLINESRMISLAQLSRGIDMNEGIIGRARRYPARLLPIFASALRRSDSISLLLASRGFDSSRLPRKVVDLKFTQADYVVLAVIAAGWVVWKYLQWGRV